MTDYTKYEYIIGIDPGVKTGIAVWRRTEKRLISVESNKHHNAVGLVLLYHTGLGGVFVRFEDARQRKWFGNMDAKQKKYGAAVREGVGSVKRDSQLWEEFLTMHKIDFEAVAPKNNRTKLTGDTFKKYTKWASPTNEHSRDAAMLVFNF